MASKLGRRKFLETELLRVVCVEPEVLWICQWNCAMFMCCIFAVICPFYAYCDVVYISGDLRRLGGGDV